MAPDRWYFASFSPTITQGASRPVQFAYPIVPTATRSSASRERNPPDRMADLGALNAPIGVEAGGADLRAVLASGVAPSNVRQFPNDPAMMDGLLPAGRETYFVIAHSALLSVLRRRDVKVAVSYPLADYAPHASSPWPSESRILGSVRRLSGEFAETQGLGRLSEHSA